MLFGLLAFLLRLAYPSRPVRLILLDLVLLACATELSQFFIDNRSPLVTDVLIDMAGGAAGLGLCLINQTSVALFSVMFIIINMELQGDMEALGRKIREARKQRGLLQKDLAAMVPTRRQVIGELERGRYRGSLAKASDILRAMGLRLTIEPVRFPTLDELSDD